LRAAARAQRDVLVRLAQAAEFALDRELEAEYWRAAARQLPRISPRLGEMLNHGAPRPTGVRQRDNSD
jgi:hypothetical protein